MISRLKVELEKVTPFREDLNGYRNVFTLKIPFKDIQTDMPPIKHQLPDGCTETEIGRLTMSG